MSYKRVLLKISGEMLAGQHEGGVDPQFIKWLAKEVKPVANANVEVVIMVGGGNFLRGAQIAGGGISRVNADFMGMFGTMMNALAVTDIFNNEAVETRALSNIEANQVLDQFTHRRAISHIQKGRVVIVAGGIGRPFLTTDTAAVSLALELNCEVILKATKVDGVYDKDPAIHEDAVKLESVSLQEAVQNESIKVMDKAALGLATEQGMPIIVFDLEKDGNILKVVSGETIGTKVS